MPKHSTPQAARFLAELESEYARRFPKSLAFDRRRSKVLLDGTSHAARWNVPFQLTIARADGAVVHDLDGHRIVDYWQGHYANLLGHDPEPIRRALGAALAEGRGLQTGMLHPLECEVAELVTRQTGTDVVRFTTSGALATFYSVLLARAFTRRSLVLKVSGGWHGSQPFGLKGVSAKDGSFDHLESKGLPATTERDIELVRYNDVAALRGVFARRGGELACFIVEPMLGSGGGILASPEFLREARKLTQEHGALLVCDEIITGFRFRAGDLSSLYGVKPDLLVLGKVLGGGMPVAAVAGRRDVMALCGREQGLVRFEGGTYSAHELSLLAAKTMLELLIAREREIYARLAQLGERMRRSLAQLFSELGARAHLSGAPNEAVAGSSIVMLHFAAKEGPAPSCAEELFGPDAAHPHVDDEIWRSALLLEDVSARHGLGAVSLAHDERDLEATLAGCRRALLRLRRAELV